MSENNFEEILNFIVDSFPQYKNNKLNINQIINLLKTLLENRISELVQNGIHRDDWMDDDKIQQLEEYINIIDN
jgi:hypothetical protein